MLQRVFGPQEDRREKENIQEGGDRRNEKTNKTSKHSTKSHEEKKKSGFKKLEERNNSTLTNFS